jgi:hypothetical protein
VVGVSPRALGKIVRPRRMSDVGARPLNFSVRRRQVRTLTPSRILLACSALVALSTIAFPWIQGYGTILGQVVVLGAWGVVAALTSGRYADLHHGIVWTVALFLNVLIFSIPAGLFYAAMHRRLPRAFGLTVAVWCLLYLGCLFVLFRATIGP